MTRDELAAKYLPLCKAWARKIATHKGRPNEADQAQSVALGKLAEMLAEYDPADGHDSFGRFVKYRVGREVNRYLTLDRPRGRSPGRYGARPLLTESLPGSLGDADEWQPSPAPPVGWEVDAEDRVRALAARLPGRHGEVIVARYLYADARKPAGCATRMGMNPHYVAQLHREALEMLRSSLSGGGVTPNPGRARDAGPGGRPRPTIPACGKVVHASRRNAKVAVKSLRGAGKSDEARRPLVAYFCEPCGGWHVGHQPHKEAPVSSL